MDTTRSLPRNQHGDPAYSAVAARGADLTMQNTDPSASRQTGALRRKYVPRACEECRRRRVKCDGQKPSCSRCQERVIECVWSNNTDHRGSAPRSYVSLLQARIQNLERVLQLHAIDVESSLANLARHTETQAPLPGGKPSSPSQNNAKFPGNWASTSSHKHPSPSPHNSNSVTDENNTVRDAPFFGVTSGRLELHPDEDRSTNNRSTPDMDLDNCHDDSKVGNRNEAEDFSSAAPRRHFLAHAPLHPLTQDPELIEHLVDLYFEWEQPWLQVVDETLFRDSWHRNGRYYSPLLLDCILALASRYSMKPEVRSNPNDANTAGQAFCQSAEARLQSELKWPRITTVQSLSLLSIYYVAIGSDAAGWLHHGMSIRLILDMGINIDPKAATANSSSGSGSGIRCGPGGQPTPEIQLRQQIYWSLYCTDKLWASYTGRVCTMLDSQGSVPPVTEPPALPDAEADPRRHRKNMLLTFLRYLSTQCQILEKILTRLYAPKATIENETEGHLFLHDCLLSLQGWFFSLPRELKLQPDQTKATLPHIYVLHMCYHTSTILLVKPFLPTRGRRLSNHTHPLGGQHALQLGQEAAKAICYLGNRYRDVYGGFRRSPLTATHCTLTAALMTLYLARGDEGTRSARAQLESCAMTLRELAVAWLPAGRYHATLSRLIDDMYGRNGGSHDKAQTEAQDPQGPQSPEKHTSILVKPSNAGETTNCRPNSQGSETPVHILDYNENVSNKNNNDNDFTTDRPQEWVNGVDPMQGLLLPPTSALGMEATLDMNAPPPVDWDHVPADLGQLSFDTFSVLPMDYLNYDPPYIDYSWFPSSIDINAETEYDGTI